MIMIPFGILLVRKTNQELKSDIILEIGQIGLVLNSLYYGAIPAAVVNIVCAIIGLFNIRKDIKVRNLRKKIQNKVKDRLK